MKKFFESFVDSFYFTLILSLIVWKLFGFELVVVGCLSYIVYIFWKKEMRK